MADSKGAMTANPFSDALTDWYDANARTLPWRSPDVTPWGVLVSEIMLQQTPAARVAPVWADWLQRWPEPAALAAEAPGEAVRAWGRLGYPRRALRLHATAVALLARHDGRVPTSYDDLLALPGIGGYTAAAVAAFAFGQRQAVLDTNVRRVHARAIRGMADVRTAAPTVAERREALDLVPVNDPAHHSIAVMELGAVVCTARSPRCAECPLLDACAWHRAGCPPDSVVRRAQGYAGTDRQVRGRLLSVLRETSEPVVSPAALEATWSDAEQRERALAGLLADGLVQRTADGAYRLPA